MERGGRWGKERGRGNRQRERGREGRWSMMMSSFVQGSKPWRYTGKEENMEREDVKMLVRRWWEVYSDEGIDRLQTPAAALAAVSDAGVVHYITAPSAA